MLMHIARWIVNAAALLLVAYERLHSGWAIALVLLGEFLPGIVLARLSSSSRRCWEALSRVNWRAWVSSRASACVARWNDSR